MSVNTVPLIKPSDVHANLYPTVVQEGGLLQPLSWIFAVLQYLGNILLLLDSLSCDLQDEVNIMGYGADGVRGVIQNGRYDGRHLGYY